ncbi:MAG: hypothetical protein ACRDHM_06570, partial [Actinomycetota bacterium]
MTGYKGKTLTGLDETAIVVAATSAGKGSVTGVVQRHTQNWRIEPPQQITGPVGDLCRRLAGSCDDQDGIDAGE